MVELANELMALIEGVGFPIAMVVYFIWDKNKTTEKMIENQNATTQILAETLNHNTSSILKISTVMEKLLVKLGAEELANE